MEEQRAQNRRKFNMIFLYLQKKEIYKNYKCVGTIFEKNYFLTNKTWFKNYIDEFKFDEIELNDEITNLSYDEAKEKYFLKELNENGTPFQDMHCKLDNYKKEEDNIIKDNYEINVPLNIELIYEDYFSNYMQGINNNFGFEHVKVYSMKETMLIVKSGNKKQIFICDLENYDDEEFNFRFDIHVEGIIILEKIDLDIILEQIFAHGINKYLENNKINKEIEEIQNIKNNKGEIFAKYIKYVKSNIDKNKNEDNIIKKEDANIKIPNAFYEGNNNNNNNNNNEENSNSEKSELDKEEEEEMEEEEEEDDKKDDVNVFIKLYWKYVPDFYLSEVLNQCDNNNINQPSIQDSRNIDAMKINDNNYPNNQVFNKGNNNQKNSNHFQMNNQNQNNNSNFTYNNNNNINRNINNNFMNNNCYNNTNNYNNNFVNQNYPQNSFNVNNNFNNNGTFNTNNNFGYNNNINSGNNSYNNGIYNQNNNNQNNNYNQNNNNNNNYNFSNQYNNNGMMINQQNNNNSNFNRQKNFQANNNNISFSQNNMHINRRFINNQNSNNTNNNNNLAFNKNYVSESFSFNNPLQNSWNNCGQFNIFQGNNNINNYSQIIHNMQGNNMNNSMNNSMNNNFGNVRFNNTNAPYSNNF